jgi:hypothetical protein
MKNKQIDPQTQMDGIAIEVSAMRERIDNIFQSAIKRNLEFRMFKEHIIGYLEKLVKQIESTSIAESKTNACFREFREETLDHLQKLREQIDTVARVVREAKGERSETNPKPARQQRKQSKQEEQR